MGKIIDLTDKKLWHLKDSWSTFMLLEKPRLLSIFYDEDDEESTVYIAPAVRNGESVDHHGNVYLYILSFSGKGEEF